MEVYLDNSATTKPYDRVVEEMTNVLTNVYGNPSSLHSIGKMAEDKYNINIQVKKIINNFFGETITVSGLITGVDLYEQLKDVDLGEYLLLPNLMISDYTNHTENKNKFLDDMTVEELEDKLNTKIILTSGGGRQILADILGVK